MAEGPSRNARSGGCLLAFSIFAGVTWGMVAGQTSIGFLAGAAVGFALLLLVWLLDRRRGG